MKKLSIFMCMIFVALLVIPSVTALFPIKNYEEESKIYEVRDWLGLGYILPLGNNFDVELIDNTDFCLVNCEATLRFHFYNDFTVDNALRGFETRFYTIAKEVDRNYQYEVLTDYTYDCVVRSTLEPRFRSNIVGWNKDNKSITALEEYYVETKEWGKCIGQRYEAVDLAGFEFEADRDYYIKLKGTKHGEENVEWVKTFDNIKLDEWTWWNSSCHNRRRIEYSTTNDYYGTGEQTGNITHKLTFDTSATGNFTSYGGAQDFYFVLNSSSWADPTEKEIHWWNSSVFNITQTNVSWRYNTDFDKNSNLTIYYNCTNNENNPPLNSSNNVGAPQSKFNYSGGTCVLNYNLDEGSGTTIGNICGNDATATTDNWDEQSWFYGGLRNTTAPNPDLGPDGNSYLMTSGGYIPTGSSDITNITDYRIITWWYRTDSSAETVGFFDFKQVNKTDLAMTTAPGWVSVSMENGLQEDIFFVDNGRDGRWHHVIVYYDFVDSPKRIRVYFDGNMSGDGTVKPNNANQGTYNEIGRQAQVDGRTLDGEMDEFMIIDGIKLSNETAIQLFQQMMNGTFDYLDRNAQENYDDYSAAAPVISISSPTNRTYNVTTIDFNVTANKEVNTWWYSHNGGANTTFTPNTTITGTVGTNTLDVWANESNGLTRATGVNFTIDTTRPTVNIINPTNTTQLTKTLSIEITANDAIDVWQISWNGTVFETIAGNVSREIPSYGTNRLFLRGNDSAGNRDETDVNFSFHNMTVQLEGLNNTRANVSLVNMTCNASTTGLGDSPIRNVSLYINTTAGINETRSMGGEIFNETTFKKYLVDGNHTWYCEYGSDAQNKLSDANYSVYVDLTAPKMLIDSPINALYNITKTSDLTLQYNNDSIGECWYELNGGAKTLMAGCLNTTVQLSTRTNYLTISVNDSDGNINYTSVVFDTWNITNVSYETNVDESTVSIYSINASFNTSRIRSQVEFWWNNTNQTISTTNYSDGIQSNSTITIPLVLTTENSTVVSFNWTFYMNYIETSNTTTTYSDTYSQSLNSIQIDDCTSYTNLAFNFTYYDEHDFQRIAENNETNTFFKATFNFSDAQNNVRVWNFSKLNQGNKTWFAICKNNDSAIEFEAEIEYGSFGYRTHDYRLFNRTSVSGGTNISLYLLNTTLAPTVKHILIVQDENGNEKVGVIINISKYDEGLNQWGIVKSGLTDGNGKLEVWLLSDQSYRFEFYEENELISSETRYTDSTTLTFIIVPSIPFKSYGYKYYVNYTIDFNNETNITTLFFDARDIPGDNFNRTCMKVIKRSALLGDETICDYNCSTNTETTITCDTQTTTGTFLALVTTRIEEGDETNIFPLVNFDFKKSITGAWEYFGTDGVFAAIIIISIFVMIGVFSPGLAMILGVIGFIFTSMLGLVELSWTIVISVVMVCIILLMKMFGRRGI